MFGIFIPRFFFFNGLVTSVKIGKSKVINNKLEGPFFYKICLLAFFTCFIRDTIDRGFRVNTVCQESKKTLGSPQGCFVETQAGGGLRFVMVPIKNKVFGIPSPFSNYIYSIILFQ